MPRTINIKDLRASLKDVIKEVHCGESFLVLHRSRPAFRIVPCNESERASIPLEKDSLYRAGGVGRSADGRLAADHDRILYGKGGK